MPRDYKNAGRRPQRQPTPGWVWMLAGLAVGLFIALLVFLHQRYPASGSRSTQARASKHASVAPARPRAAHEAKRAGAGHAARSAAARPAPSPKFDFYTILPEMEVMVPDQDITGKVEHGVTQIATPGTYVLQAGSFRRYDQADHLKAQLALLGLNASIQSVTINGDETWHRVRIGPFHNLNRLNQAREVLKTHHVEALLLKLKG